VGRGAGLITRTLDKAVPGAAICQNPVDWDREADVVVIGAGATGLPAAIVACEAGCSVILVEAEKDIGGHAIISGGNVPLGGGTSAQQKHGIADSPDLLFRDLTDWSVVGPNGFPDYRYNDREIIRAFADNSTAKAWHLRTYRRRRAGAAPFRPGHRRARRANRDRSAIHRAFSMSARAAHNSEAAT
jgi:succinate dehydrogenase/fumarate reductase flavoprotein subunit